MSVVTALLRRDLGQMFGGAGRGATLMPVLFFLAVAMLYPFAVGPAPELLRRTGGGIVWVAALLAAILQSNARMAGLWLLDEPLNGLDKDASAAFQVDVGAFLAQGGIAVVASHQPFAVPGIQRLELADFAP